MGELQLGGEVHPVCYLAEGVGNRGRACRGHGGRSYYSGQTASLSCGLPQCSRGLILSSPVRPPSGGRPPLLDPLLPAPLIQISDACSLSCPVGTPPHQLPWLHGSASLAFFLSSPAARCIALSCIPPLSSLRRSSVARRTGVGF